MPTELTAALFSTVGRLRRQLRRSAPRGFEGTGLTEAQAELLRLVGRQPGISVSQAAAELGLVANTASTLVSKLSAEGLVLREADPDDRRIGRLRLTESAQRVADKTRAARHAVLADVIDELDADEITALEGGLTVLDKMTRLLNERQS
ncbi:MAG TPA: MarR family transcriptional regulator [Mycobacterium sp.]|nr:MarR family transcriptional regulator [Mycobacterium sp.]